MATTAGTPPTGTDDKRTLFQDVIVNDNGRITIDTKKLGEDSDHLAEVGSVLLGRLGTAVSDRAKAFMAELGGHIQSASDEVKARRDGGNSAT